MTNQEKIDAAFRELWEVVIRERIAFEFASPKEYPQEEYGEFNAGNYSIRVFKERTSLLTSWHIYALAHEIQHFKQYVSLMGPETWFYAIDGTNIDNLQEDAQAELEADDYAVNILSKYKIRIPTQLGAFIADRLSHYQSKLGR
jgi:hypothetical protein